MTNPLPGQLLPVASLTRNDSGVTGTTVKDALDTLQGEIDTIEGSLSSLGNVLVDLPSVAGTVPAWDDTAGELRASTAVKIHAASSDKFETAAEFGAFVTSVDGATITFDLDTANRFAATLAGNRTLAYTHASVGQRVLILLLQDGTGGRSVTWWSQIEWNQGGSVLDPTANGWDLIVLECVGTVTISAGTFATWKEVSRSTSAPRAGITTATDAATVTFDLRLSPFQRVVLGGNRTLALTAGSFYTGMRFSLSLVQDATGGRTVTWFSGITWAAGSAPTLTTTASKSDRFVFVCTDAAGPTFEGYVVGQGM